jgi:predicted secreted protein
MAAQSGNIATFTWNAVLVGDVAAIGSVTMDGAVIDVTELSTDTFRQFISGKYQMSFSIELFYNHTAHSSLTTDFLNRDARTFAIDFGDGNVSGTAILTNVAVSANVDDPARLSVSAQCTGAVAIVA